MTGQEARNESSTYQSPLIERDGATLRATFDVSPMIREQTRRVNEAMDTAALYDVLTWLRSRGYEVTQPAGDEEARDDEHEALNIDAIAQAAEAQAEAYRVMLLIGEGVGGLGVRHPERFETILAWQDSTENDHADTVLALIARIRELEAAARKHPEPEITEARVEAAARQMHMRAAGFEGRKSWDETTDRIRQGWRDAARDALEAAFRVPVGEGKQG